MGKCVHKTLVLVALFFAFPFVSSFQGNLVFFSEIHQQQVAKYFSNETMLQQLKGLNAEVR
jgi:hypothetical protein